MQRIIEILGNHPMIALLTLCGTVFGAGVAAALFFANHSHKVEITGLADQHESEVNKLTSQINHIERNIAGKKPNEYFELGSSLVNEHDFLRSSPREYRTLIRKVMSVNAPEQNGWMFEEMSEDALLSMRLDDECRSEGFEQSDMPRTDPGHSMFVWHKRDSKSVFLSRPSVETDESDVQQDSERVLCDYTCMFPSIAAYVLNERWIRENGHLCFFFPSQDEEATTGLRQLCMTPDSGT